MNKSRVFFALEPTTTELIKLYREKESTCKIDYVNNQSLASTGEDAGLDLFCPEEVVIKARSVSNLVDLKVRGVMVDSDNTPIHYLIYPRSSMGFRTPLRLSNQVGVIDCGYRDTLKIILDNNSDEDYVIKNGDRLVQVCSSPLSSFDWSIFDDGDIAKIYPSKRDTTGLGSSGR